MDVLTVACRPSAPSSATTDCSSTPEAWVRTRAHGLCRSDGEVGEPEAVDAHVQRRTAALLPVEEARRGVRTDLPADIGRREPHLAEVTTVEHLRQDVELRQVARPHRLGDEHTGGPRCVGELLGLPRRDRDRLLDEDVLPGGDRQHGQRVVLPVRSAT